MKNLNPINRAEYVQMARNLYRQETEKRKTELIQSFSEDFSRLDQQEQELMKQDLMNELEECRKKLVSAKGKTKAKLEKDIELFSILAKELGIDCIDSDKLKDDLKLINQALQKATDDPLRTIKKSDFKSPIAQQKYEEFDQAMKSQPRGVYSRSALFQQLGDYLEEVLSGKNEKPEIQSDETQDNEPRENDEKETSSQLDEEKYQEEIIAEFSDSDF